MTENKKNTETHTGPEGTNAGNNSGEVEQGIDKEIPSPQIKTEPKTAPDSVQDYKDKYFRLLAEFENVRKRMEREKIEFIKYANENLLADFLTILDDLERSIQALRSKQETSEAFLKGIEMVLARVYEMLKRNGVKVIEAKGKFFDPHCHEILMQEETDASEENLVLEEFQRGYYLGDKVLRTAKVKIAKSKN